jgi:hypothetical protein
MAEELFVPEGPENGIDLERKHPSRLRLYDLINACVQENDGLILWSEILEQLHADGFYASQTSEAQIKKIWSDVKVRFPI